MSKYNNTRHDDADAFIRNPEDGFIPSDGNVEGELLEDYMRGATGDEDEIENRDEVFTEEMGGPFVTTTAGTELADGFDETNPPETEPAGQPSAMRGK